MAVVYWLLSMTKVQGRRDQSSRSGFASAMVRTRFDALSRAGVVASGGGHWPCDRLLVMLH